jgi:GH35 family endo-1,4-beta-xylanase
MITQEGETQMCMYTDRMDSMKWDAVEASRGVFTFDTADQTAAFAAENGKLLRCHTLLWHSQLPAWVEGITDKAELTEVIETHIAEVAGHFKGKCFAWVSFDLHGKHQLGPVTNIS